MKRSKLANTLLVEAESLGTSPPLLSEKFQVLALASTKLCHKKMLLCTDTFQYPARFCQHSKAGGAVPTETEVKVGLQPSGELSAAAA